MTAWEYLQLEKTDDERAIKKAYARLLKTIDTDDKEAFITLRSAYEIALNESRQQSIYREPFQSFVQYPENTEVAFEAIDSESAMITIEKNIRNLSLNFYKENNLMPWKDLLQQVELWSLEIRQDTEVCFLKIVEKEYRWLTRLDPAIWILLSNFFDWETREFELYRKYPRSIIDTLLWQVRPAVGHINITQCDKPTANSILNAPFSENRGRNTGLMSILFHIIEGVSHTFSLLNSFLNAPIFENKKKSKSFMSILLHVTEGVCRIFSLLTRIIVKIIIFATFIFYGSLVILLLYAFIVYGVFGKKDPIPKSTQEHHIKIPSGTFPNGLGSPEAFVENLNAPKH